MKHNYALLTLVLMLYANLALFGQSPIAEGQDKFLGNVYGSGQVTDFTSYWNQVTPENAGKWGSVERNRDEMNWGSLDAAYKLAKDNGFPFRFHILIWGNQQPGWIENLEPAEQLEEIEEWFAAVAERYPDIDYLEVVNEPLHDAPEGTGNGNYIEALGGSGETGWDWVLTSFRLARQYFPETPLMLNDYNIIGSANNVGRYREIIDLLMAEDLIDLIGFQAHAFSTKNAHVSTLRNNLDFLADRGLPLMVTEMDIDGPTDKAQLREYQRIFPIFWEHTSMEGVTLWGWKHGMWRTNEGAYLMLRDGTERPALTWLRAYVRGELVEVSSIEVTGDADIVEVGSNLQLEASVNPDEATLTQVEWSVEPATGSSARATITENGLLTAESAGPVRVIATALDGSGVTGEAIVEISAVTSVDSRGLESFTLYPNPVTNGSFRLKGTHQFTQLKVLDIRGNKLKEADISKTIGQAAESSFEIELNVAPGLYLIQLSDGQNSSFRKIMVK